MSLANQWPGAALTLVTELEQAPDRIALLQESPEAHSLFATLVDVLQAEVVDLGFKIVEGGVPDVDPQLIANIEGPRIVRDIEVLFEPQLQINVLQYIRRIARQQVSVVVWPGSIDRGWATFSAPGRKDYFSSQLSNALVLRPLSRKFPDEVPYEVERVA